jgi:hypothetical protein
VCPPSEILLSIFSRCCWRIACLITSDIESPVNSESSRSQPSSSSVSRKMKTRARPLSVVFLGMKLCISNVCRMSRKKIQLSYVAFLPCPSAPAFHNVKLSYQTLTEPPSKPSVVEASHVPNVRRKVCRFEIEKTPPLLSLGRPPGKTLRVCHASGRPKEHPRLSLRYSKVNSLHQSSSNLHLMSAVAGPSQVQKRFKPSLVQSMSACAPSITLSG